MNLKYEGKIISIPHTLLISAIGVMEDVSKSGLNGP